MHGEVWSSKAVFLQHCSMLQCQVGGPPSCNMGSRIAANKLQSTPFKHTCTSDTHKYTPTELLSWGALISTEQTPRVMGMFSGCYLVLCRNKIASHLYHHPQTLEGPWPLLEEGPLGCQGTLTNWLPEKRDCQGIVSTASVMTDRRLEGLLGLGSLAQPRESTL